MTLHLPLPVTVPLTALPSLPLVRNVWPPESHDVQELQGCQRALENLTELTELQLRFTGCQESPFGVPLFCGLGVCDAKETVEL